MLEQTIIEKTLLGLVIRKPWLISKTIGLVNPDHFLDDKNKLIYLSLESLFNKKGFEKSDTESELDYKIILKELNGILKENQSKYFNIYQNDTNKWLFYIADLISDSGSENNLDDYLKLLVDEKNKRDLSNVLKESLSKIKISGKDSENLIFDIEKDIFQVSRNRELRDFIKIDKISHDFREKLKKIKSKGYSEGLKAKIEQLDNIVGGFRNGEFIVIAARPSMGKTAFAIQIMTNLSKTKKVAFFSLEMSSQLILQRLISLETDIKQDFFRKYDTLPQPKVEIINEGIKNIESNLIWIDDTPAIKLNELIWKIRKLNSMVGLDMVIIDYLQLIEVSGKIESRQQSISEISRSLKAIAREINIPVITLSQLSRKVESRESKKPMMSDLRESGAIEQDADVILLLYRENYYNKIEEQDLNVVEDLDVIVAKNRNGKIGVAKLDINMEIGRITSKKLEGFFN